MLTGGQDEHCELSRITMPLTRVDPLQYMYDNSIVPMVLAIP